MIKITDYLEIPVHFFQDQTFPLGIKVFELTFVKDKNVVIHFVIHDLNP